MALTPKDDHYSAAAPPASKSARVAVEGQGADNSTSCAQQVLDLGVTHLGEVVDDLFVVPLVHFLLL